MISQGIIWLHPLKSKEFDLLLYFKWLYYIVSIAAVSHILKYSYVHNYAAHTHALHIFAAICDGRRLYSYIRMLDSS